MKLFPYQEEGVKRLVSSKRMLLADEQGCGKTVQVLEAVRAGGFKNVLIVVPAALVLLWEREAKKWLGNDANVGVLFGKRREVILKDGVQNVVVCSYNFVQKPEAAAMLKPAPFDVIVCDEAHKLKNWNSKTTKNFSWLVDGFKGHLWMLTGTPATRAGSDYYPFVKLLSSSQYKEMSYKVFCDTFCLRQYNPWSGGFTYKSVKPTMQEVLRKCFKEFTLRRRKAEVLPQLPAKIVQNMPVAVDSSAISECLNLDVNDIRERIRQGLNLPGHVMHVMRSIGLAKVYAAVELIENMDEPVVVMGYHIDVLNALKEKFKSAVMITGQEDAWQKQHAVDSFQKGVSKIAICNFVSGGVGITLTAASKMIFIELPWSPALMIQAEDRIHRIGAVNKCQIIRLIGDKTIDEDVIGVLGEKMRFMKATMGDV